MFSCVISCETGLVHSAPKLILPTVLPIAIFHKLVDYTQGQPCKEIFGLRLTQNFVRETGNVPHYYYLHLIKS